MAINIDIYFPELACDFVTIDVMYSTGLVVLWILKIRYHYRYIFISLYSLLSQARKKQWPRRCVWFFHIILYLKKKKTEVQKRPFRGARSLKKKKKQFMNIQCRLRILFWDSLLCFLQGFFEGVILSKIFLATCKRFLFLLLILGALPNEDKNSFQSHSSKIRRERILIQLQILQKTQQKQQRRSTCPHDE